jgi:hypothetical protein
MRTQRLPFGASSALVAVHLLQGCSGAGHADGSGASGGGSVALEAGAPHTVGACTSLPPAGTWEYISPLKAALGDPTGKNFAGAVVVDPFDPATVWHGIGYAGIFKSTDCGATWTHVSTGANGSQLDSGSPVSIVVDPVNQGTMYVAEIYGPPGVWKSTNGGVDWEQLFPPTSAYAQAVQYSIITSISMDPTNPLHLVVSPHAGCAAPYAPLCEAETMDGGKTWTIATLPFLTQWEEGAGAWVLNETSWIYAGQSGLFLTTDHGASWQNVTPAGVSFQSGPEDEIPIGPDGTHYMTSTLGLLTSPDGRTWTRAMGCNGRLVGLALGDGTLYTADQWSTTYWVASLKDLTCSMLAAPAAMPSGKGAAFLAYDTPHHVLYSSNIDAGLWRTITP